NLCSLSIRSTCAGLSIAVPATLSGVPNASIAEPVTLLRSPGPSVVVSAGSRRPPTDTAQLLDISALIQELVQRLGKRAREAGSFCGLNGKRHRSATNLSL